MTTRNSTVDNLSQVTTSCGTGISGTLVSVTSDGANSPRVNGRLKLRDNWYSLERHSLTSGVGVWRFPPSMWPYYGDRWRTGTYGSCFGGVGYPALNQAQLDAKRLKAVNRLGERVTGHKFNAAIFAAEANESVKMIGDTALRLARSFTLLRKREFSQALQVLTGQRPHPTQIKSLNRSVSRGGKYSTDKAFADNVLAVQYGWRPLLGDIAESARALEVIHNRGFTTTQVFRSGYQVSDQGSTAFGDRVGEIKERVTLLWRVEFRQEPPVQSFLREFGFLDPAQVVWEKIPFSFVADWVLPVGSWLQARAYVSNISGTFVESVLRTTRVRNPPAGPYDIDMLYGESSVHFTRSVGSISNTVLPLPSWKNPFSAEHALNGISLLTSIFRH